ncbi:MAG: ExbD/TolR family protein [Candidatus Zhuqueibacterota bacterium]
MRFYKKTRVEGSIPTASLPDIVFMLLIFFMVTTQFKEFRGIPVRLPSAQQIEKLPGKRNVAYIWADDRGRVSIDDKFVDTSVIAKIMTDKCNDPLHPLRVVSMKIDQNVKMGLVTKIHEELRNAGGGALNLNYSTKTLGK